MSFDLTNKNISDTFQNLLQKTGSDNQLYDLKGNQIIDLTIAGALHAQSYIVSQSVVNTSSGSTQFGDSSDDTHTFEGDISASGGFFFGDDTTYISGSNGNLKLTGRLSATKKSFEIPHPTKPDKILVYDSLEGPEYGVYIRGKLENKNIIYLPEYWTKLVDKNTITVQLTPIKNYQKLYVEKIKSNKVYIGKNGFKNINCYYNVYAERKDGKIEVEGQ